jgi:hypothetical protein
LLGFYGGIEDVESIMKLSFDKKVYYPSKFFEIMEMTIFGNYM